MKILIVDDDPDLLSLVGFALSQAGFVVVKAADVPTALKVFAAESPDLAILDINLPGGSGFDICEAIRRQSRIPVMMLTARGEEEDLVRALDLGADDYLTKPFGTGELLARIRVVMRRVAQGPAGPVFTSDDLTMDLARRVVTASGQEVHLSPTEYDLLRALVLHAGKVLTHRQLLRQVWGPAYEQEAHLLRVTVGHLRHKLEPDPARPRWIITEPGVGYRLRVSA